jgi:3-isopropylmalate dehydratase small subunit
VAVSFARIFYRNAFNISLPILEYPEAVADIESGHQLDVDIVGGRKTGWGFWQGTR